MNTVPPSNHKVAANYSRFSSDQQDESSIDQQRATCRARAAQDGYETPAEFEFADHAVSGTKLRRDGLDAMRHAAKAGQVAVIYFHSLSRLARESVISMPILKELVYVFQVRIVSIADGVDSNQPGWELSATINSVLHERYLSELSANVLRGQIGTLTEGFSVGDYCFGYLGEAIPGSERRRRGAGAKPRMRYVIDPEAANWVRQAFHWFVVERRTIRWIAKQLTRHRVPKSRGSTKPGWHHQVVTRLLGNSKYVGIWPWGVVRGRRNPLTGQALRDHRSAEEREKWTRNLPELQIVEREIFEQAQKLLRENRKHVKPGGGGMFSRHRKDRAQTAPQHLLAGLLVCGECGHRLYAGGSRAKYLFCPNYQRGTCTCQTTVARALAEELILRPISKQLLSNSAWFNEVLNSTLASWRRQQAQLPNALKSAETAINEAERRIRRLVDALEDDESDSGEIRARLQERRAELETLKSRRDRLSASVGAVPAEPTAEWLLSKLQNLTKILHSATPAAAFSLRDLVGGQVVVTEVKRPGKQRHFLRGRFVLRDGAITALLRLPDDGSNAAEEAGEVVEIDFVRINPLNAKAEEVKELYDQGLLNVVIAEKLGCSKAQVTKLLKHWSKVHDVTLPCGYSRRSQLTQKTAQPTMCQKHAE